MAFWALAFAVSFSSNRIKTKRSPKVYTFATVYCPSAESTADVHRSSYFQFVSFASRVQCGAQWRFGHGDNSPLGRPRCRNVQFPLSIRPTKSECNEIIGTFKQIRFWGNFFLFSPRLPPHRRFIFSARKLSTLEQD